MNTSHHNKRWHPNLGTLQATFYNVFLSYEFDNQTLFAIAEKAGVSKETAENMLMSIAVHRVDAKKILAAFSEYTGKEYRLDNVRVSLLPTFHEVCEDTKVTIETLTIATTRVSRQVFELLLADKPVTEVQASLGLQTLTFITGRKYSLANVDVRIEEPENKSDVARTLQRINEEYESTQRGMYGLKEGTTRHQFITAGMERIADTILGLPENQREQVLIHLNNESTDTATP